MDSDCAAEKIGVSIASARNMGLALEREALGRFSGMGAPGLRMPDDEPCN